MALKYCLVVALVSSGSQFWPMLLRFDYSVVVLLVAVNGPKRHTWFYFLIFLRQDRFGLVEIDLVLVGWIWS